jgi:hypothetical protein
MMGKLISRFQIKISPFFTKSNFFSEMNRGLKGFEGKNG